MSTCFLKSTPSKNLRTACWWWAGAWCERASIYASVGLYVSWVASSSDSESDKKLSDELTSNRCWVSSNFCYSIVFRLLWIPFSFYLRLESPLSLSSKILLYSIKLGTFLGSGFFSYDIRTSICSVFFLICFSIFIFFLYLLSCFSAKLTKTFTCYVISSLSSVVS